MIRIHNFARGVRGLRLMWQCEEMAIPYERVLVTYPVPDAYRALHPLGSVPYLEDDATGASMSESVAIMLYLATQYGPTALLPTKGDPRLPRVLQMLAFSEATLGGPINALLAAQFGAPDADKKNWSVRGIESRVEKSIAYIEGILGDGSYLAGDELTLADLAITTSLGMWFGPLKKAASERMTAYRERLAERPAYVRARAICDAT